MRAREVTKVLAKPNIKCSEYYHVNRARAIKLREAFAVLNEYIHVLHLAEYKDHGPQDMPIELPYFNIDIETGILYFKWTRAPKQRLELSFIQRFNGRLLWELLKRPIEKVVVTRFGKNTALLYLFGLEINGEFEIFSDEDCGHKRISIYGPLKYVRTIYNDSGAIIDGKVYCSPDSNADAIFSIKTNEQDIYVTFTLFRLWKLSGIPLAFNYLPLFDGVKRKSLIPYVTKEIVLNPFNQLTAQILDFQYILNNHEPFTSFTVDPTNEFCLTITYKDGRIVPYCLVLQKCEEFRYYRAFIVSDCEKFELEFNLYSVINTRPILTNRDGELTIIDCPAEGLYTYLYDNQKIYYKDFTSKFKQCFQDIYKNYYILDYQYMHTQCKRKYYAAYFDNNGKSSKKAYTNAAGQID